jgi:hypothetical protein
MSISPGSEIAAGDVWIATGIDGQIAGVVALAPGEVPGKVDRGTGSQIANSVDSFRTYIGLSKRNFLMPSVK